MRVADDRICQRYDAAERHVSPHPDLADVWVDVRVAVNDVLIEEYCRWRRPAMFFCVVAGDRPNLDTRAPVDTVYTQKTLCGIIRLQRHQVGGTNGALTCRPAI